MPNHFPARVKKVDGFNWAVEVFKPPEYTLVGTGEIGADGKEKRKRVPGGEPRWEETAFYGHRLDFACQFALHESFEVGAIPSPDDIISAVQMIVAETRKLFNGGDDEVKPGPKSRKPRKQS